ncbi:WD40 repeat-like protein [Panus rudis PR-1116 ss-1]|nr:WD40 repeat-like protein [Panus rudis PR-1116 ss-1]
MGDSTPCITVPISTVQPDFQSVISDVRVGAVPEDAFWVSFYKSGEPSVHGKVHLTLDENDRSLVVFEGKDGVQFKDHGGRKYTVCCHSLNISETRIATPARQFSGSSSAQATSGFRKIHAFDIAPDGSQFAVGYEDGSIVIKPTRNTLGPYTISRPHLNTVTDLRFFPSSRVLLTAGIDLSLNILPADLPESSANAQPVKVNSVRILKGHNRGVTATAIIARGRNVLSGARDGTVRLWDVSSGSSISTIATSGYAPVNAMSIGEKGEGISAQPPNGDKNAAVTVDEREVETTGKVALVALQDGSFEIIDLGSKMSMYHSPKASSSLSAISYSSAANLVATGTSNGKISIYDTRNLSTPTLTFSRNGASIEDLVFLATQDGAGNTSLAVATEDGLPYVVDVGPNGPSVAAELIGTDCDPVRRVRLGSGRGEVWTAGDDGFVRQYVV